MERVVARLLVDVVLVSIARGPADVLEVVSIETTLPRLVTLEKVDYDV